MPYPCNSVFNPGAVQMGDYTLLLLRVEDLEGRSHFTVARSRDGEIGWQVEETPLMRPGDPAHPEEAYGCEDPRISWLDELNQYVIAYTAYSGLGAGVALATTTDFRSVERLGLMLAPNNKDAAVFPRRIGGKWWMLHRPMAGGQEHIWLTESPDLRYWGQPRILLEERGGPWWDGAKIGAGPPPIETPEGWLLIYHGVKMVAERPTYRMGLALLDLEEPYKVRGRVPYWVLGPMEPYEMSGDVPNVVFANGAVVRGEDLWLYYGAADTAVCVANAPLDALVEAAIRAGSRGSS
jgi:predicted GH43/DUF377 family glycosyl hydrolase